MNDSFEHEPNEPKSVPSEVMPDAEDAHTEGKVRVEEFAINGDALMTKVRELIHQGNIRRIIIKNEEGGTLIEIPLTVGVVGGVIGATVFPVLSAVAVIGSMVAHLTIVIEKRE